MTGTVTVCAQALRQADDAEALPAQSSQRTLLHLAITTASGELPGDEEIAATVQITETDEDGQQITRQTPAILRLRGNTSRRYPKNSYRLELRDESGGKQKLSLARLREDDDWILNPMYSDTSKIREALAFWLWEEINSCGRAARSSRLAFVEVDFNGAYYGLYGLQERIDRKQVDADKKTGILYKVDTNYRPNEEQLLQNGTQETCEGLELTFAGSKAAEPWLPAAAYIAFLAGTDLPEEQSQAEKNACIAAAGAEPSSWLRQQGDPDITPADGNYPYRVRLSRQNTLDYAIWSLLVQAKDCHYKNQFIHCVREQDGYTLYRIPWDLNHTFGDLWSGSREDSNFLDYRLDFPAMDDVLSGLMATDGDAVRRELAGRFQGLQAAGITEESVTQKAQELFEELYPAILRDHERWPEGGMGEGNAANVRDITDFIHANWQMLNRFLNGAAAQE